MSAAVLARALQWKSSVSGVAIAAVLLYVFKSFGCQFPSDWHAWGVSALPAILGILAKD